LLGRAVDHRQAQGSPDAVGGPGSEVMTAAEVRSALQPWSAVARQVKKVALGAGREPLILRNEAKPMPAGEGSRRTPLTTPGQTWRTRKLGNNFVASGEWS